jgi:thiol:disulfide interchange protein
MGDLTMTPSFKLMKAATALLTLALVLSLGALPARASEIEPFSQAAFEKAQADGEIILLDFHADWCPTCRVQSKVLSKLSGDEQFEAMRFFVVNYDKADALKQKLKVSKQSTLIVLNGAEERARLTGVVSEDQIRSLLRKGF